MKIAVITNHIPSKWAHSINTMKIAEGLYRLGHLIEVLVVQRAKEDLNRLIIKDIHNFYGINKKIKIKFFRDYSINYFKEIRYTGPILNKLFDLFARIIPKLAVRLDPEKRISKYCKKSDFDLTFCRSAYHTVYYNVINEIPTILDLHGYLIPELIHIVKLTNSKYFKGIMTLNEFLKQKLIQIGFHAEKIVFMENAVDIDKFDRITNDKKKLRKKLNLPLNKIIILYSGIISDDRGIDIILNASNYLDAENISFYFLGVGKRKNSIKKWKNYIKRNKIESNVNFLGFKPRIFIPFYLKAADILLATYSAHCIIKNYTSPVKLIEYRASKIPIIVTEIGRLKKLCNKNECLFIKVDDPKDLSEKIEILLTNIELRDMIIENAYNKAKRFILEKRSQKILELLR